MGQAEILYTPGKFIERAVPGASRTDPGDVIAGRSLNDTFGVRGTSAELGGPPAGECEPDGGVVAIVVYLWTRRAAAPTATSVVPEIDMGTCFLFVV